MTLYYCTNVHCENPEGDTPLHEPQNLYWTDRYDDVDEGFYCEGCLDGMDAPEMGVSLSDHLRETTGMIRLP